MLCQICHKNTAVLFVTKIENGESKPLAMCLSCARKSGMPLQNLMRNNGMQPEDLENIKAWCHKGIEKYFNG